MAGAATRPGSRRPRATAASPTPRAAPATPDPEAVARFVEHVGLVYEGMGLPRMAGRILGYLLVCDPPHQSMAQLQAALQASKGSISTMTRLLHGAGTLERVPVPHDRREYVRLPGFGFESVMRLATERTRAVRVLAEEGLAVLAGAPTERTERLRSMHAFYAFMERELPRTVERFRREKAASTARTGGAKGSKATKVGVRRAAVQRGAAKTVAGGQATKKRRATGPRSR